MAARASEMDLLVAGGPTHAHGMTRPATREQVLRDGKNTYEDPTEGSGLRVWMDGLPDGRGTAGAAFDTRMKGSKMLTGSAAKGIAERLTPTRLPSDGRTGTFPGHEAERARRRRARTGLRVGAGSGGTIGGEPRLTG